MKHLLRVYVIKYRYMVSINRYNTIMRNILILLHQFFSPTPVLSVDYVQTNLQCIK